MEPIEEVERGHERQEQRRLGGAIVDLGVAEERVRGGSDGDGHEDDVPK